MGVAARVVQDMDGGAKRVFGIDDPGFFRKALKRAWKASGSAREAV